MKKEEYLLAYGVPWEKTDNDADVYADASGANSIAFPGIKMPVITIEKPTEIQEYEFGFIPSWMKGDAAENRKNIHNARIETISELATWRGAWSNFQRCLVCTSGFFEHDKKRKQRVFVHLKDSEQFYYAGLFNNWVNDKTSEVRKTMAIITTVPNQLVETVHHRMPVIIAPGEELLWMDKTSDLNQLIQHYEIPFDENRMCIDDIDTTPKINTQTSLF